MISNVHFVEDIVAQAYEQTRKHGYRVNDNSIFMRQTFAAWGCILDVLVIAEGLVGLSFIAQRGD